MSTTTSEKVALQYSMGKKGKASVLLVIQQGMIHRGATLKDLSQYPGEAEVCLALS